MSAENHLARLPLAVSHWLGYRPRNASPPKPLPQYLIWAWSFVGAFCGLALIQGIFGHTNYFHARHVPGIVASYGASAVLCYGAIEAPFSQPRSLIGGHFISGLVGLCITKLFRLLPEARYNELEWLCASLCTATAIVAMQITKTTHPPAGATALLPATSPEIAVMSWYFLPVLLLSSSLLLVTALIINNIHRRYPVFWISPSTPSTPKQAKDNDNAPSQAAEKAKSKDTVRGSMERTPPESEEDAGVNERDEDAAASSDTEKDRTPERMV